jgi:hypothetical protein
VLWRQKILLKTKIQIFWFKNAIFLFTVPSESVPCHSSYNTSHQPPKENIQHLPFF